MKTVLCGMLLSAAVLAMPQVACARDYRGFYVIAKAGANRSSAFGRTRNNGYFGAEAGYDIAIAPDTIVGVDVWGDNHVDSMTGRDAGVDARLGNVSYGTLFYVKLGVTGTGPGDRVHYGLGIERLIDVNWGGLIEWTGDELPKDGTTYRNNNLALGLSYHF